MSRLSNTSERRQQIVNALLSVMAQRGYAASSINQIARAAGLTPGLVHYHFKNKQEILLALVETLAQRHDQGLEKHLSEALPDPRAQLWAFIDYHLALGAQADPESMACWVILGGEALRQQEVQSAYKEVMASLARPLREIISRGAAEKLFHCEDHAAAASALLASIQGYFVLAATARELIPRGSAALQVRKMAGGLLQVPLTGPREDQ